MDGWKDKWMDGWMDGIEVWGWRRSMPEVVAMVQAHTGVGVVVWESLVSPPAAVAGRWSGWLHDSRRVLNKPRPCCFQQSAHANLHGSKRRLERYIVPAPGAPLPEWPFLAVHAPGFGRRLLGPLPPGNALPLSRLLRLCFPAADADRVAALVGGGGRGGAGGVGGVARFSLLDAKCGLAGGLALPGDGPNSGDLTNHRTLLALLTQYDPEVWDAGRLGGVGSRASQRRGKQYDPRADAC
eukprot:361817-Chlamydomonas_euryale.AAC.1